MRATPSAHLARDELEAAPRRLVVEQDARAREQPVALAVVDGDVVRRRPSRRRTGCAGRTASARSAALRAPCRTSRSTTPGRSRIDVSHLPDGLEHAGDALRVELAGQQRLIPRCRHERHRRQVVELVRLHIGESDESARADPADRPAAARSRSSRCSIRHRFGALERRTHTPTTS